MARLLVSIYLSIRSHQIRKDIYVCVGVRRGGEGMDIAPQKTFPNQPMKMTLSRFIRRIRLLDLFLPNPSSLSALSPSLILEYKNKKNKIILFL